MLCMDLPSMPRYPRGRQHVSPGGEEAHYVEVSLSYTSNAQFMMMPCSGITSTRHQSMKTIARTSPLLTWK